VILSSQVRPIPAEGLALKSVAKSMARCGPGETRVDASNFCKAQVQGCTCTMYNTRAKAVTPVIQI